MQLPAQVNMTVSRHYSGRTSLAVCFEYRWLRKLSSKHLLMSVDSPITLPLNSRTGTCMDT